MKRLRILRTCNIATRSMLWNHGFLQREYSKCFISLQPTHNSHRKIQPPNHPTNNHHENHHAEKLNELHQNKIIPLLISPFQTNRILNQHLLSLDAKQIFFANDQTQVQTLMNQLLLNQDECLKNCTSGNVNGSKSTMIVFEGTYHNMLELYNSLKKRLSEHLNSKQEQKIDKSLKEKYLESHLSKLEFTDIISRFGILGHLEWNNEKNSTNGSNTPLSIKTKVKRLPKLDTLNRLLQFTMEKAEKFGPVLSRSDIFIPIHSLLSSIKSMDQWEKKGIQISLSEHEILEIYPQFGVYSPTRKEIFSTLVRDACDGFLKTSQTWKQMKNVNIIDIGCGTGVFGLFVARCLSRFPSRSNPKFNLQFIDINEWAMECTMKNVKVFSNKFGCHNFLGTVDYSLMDISNKEVVQQEIFQKLDSRNYSSNSPTLNLLLCNPPWISISKQDSEIIQHKRERLNMFKNVIDLSIFDTEHEFLDNFLNLVQQFVATSSLNNSQTYGMILISNVGHLLGLEEKTILETIENKCHQKRLKIVRIFTLRREDDKHHDVETSQKHSLSVKEFLVNNPLASKRKKSPHHDDIQQAKENEEVYCIVIGSGY
ncbi:hypothetical protein C9374_011690 [Naegleria lovaniensis]|uniref:Methyltransferase small domain-containing protein n=1 Tax=Naegleria lovaniensis TaxID=51637 RepID=A0AA88KCG1_NAELO|nr:uncharacterized protein C9374_011690 [Naegleria lovaniensis]KAG2373805.1 hypothetical protein C9374_011690 [Naegleria lovaniensis]